MCDREQGCAGTHAALRLPAGGRETALGPGGLVLPSLLQDLVRLKTNCGPSTMFVSPAGTWALSSPRPLL